ncbi:MAG: hypothetical protein RBG1_1C00001G0311 [candidate division Zixibacteria bacterium RBG-1]|nr:MAG: hypothetical protein RBG1_1C00001G0311 [candidate division Zixibacteria bacterium RBG-1]OGC83157.1 MAG: ribosome silencing factor [candidate division Zixibacteria bacterium RBG_19FT_COMBO_42_43]
MKNLTSRNLAVLAGKLALEKQALDIKILDLRKISNISDYFVVCSATVDVHLKAIADNIVGELEKKGIRIWHNEGYPQGRWIILDYVDVVVHIFLEEARQFYDLESLWGDAQVQEVNDNGKVKKTGKKTGLKTRKRKLM